MTDRPALRVPPPEFLEWQALRHLLAVLPEARVVGGAVRDALLGASVADIDLATPHAPAAVLEALRQAKIRAIPTGLAHGTVTAVIDGRPFEITTLRRDIATDGRHAVVAFTSDWAEDAARRDFTINALSMTADGAVFDYFGGLPDLEAGRVRFVGDPARRIAEDYLRVLRFFRFHARYGRQPPSAEEKAALRAAVPHLARLSVERVWNELRRILSGPNAGKAVGLMAELGVLAALLPEGTDTHRFGRVVDLGAPPDPILRLAGLLSPAADSHAVAERLKLSVAEADRLKAILSGPTPEPDLDDAGLRRLLANEPPDILVARTWLAGDAAPAWHRLRARLAAMPRPHFALAGRDILAAGVPPGPAVGQLLKQVRDWWIELGCEPDADACRDRLRGLLAFSSLEGGQTPRR